MATLCPCASYVPFTGFSVTVLRKIPRQLVHRNLSRTVKGKKQKAIKNNIDIQGILGSSGVNSGRKSLSDANNDSPKDQAKDEAFRKWQTSEERTNLLKQGERR